jgi:carboxyl-terminal processing protease
MSEADLESHLTSKNTRQGDKPYETIKFLAAEPPKKLAKNLLRDDDKKDDPEGEEEEADEDLPPDEKFVEDYEIQFARDLVAQAHGWKRREVLASAKPFFDKKVAAENLRTGDKLRSLGVDWSPVESDGKAPSLVASVSSDRPNNEVVAGDTVKFKASITNKGAGVAGQVRAQLKSNDPMLDGREFVFGRIKPGETRSWMLPVKIPKDALGRTDPLKLEVFEEHGAKAKLDDALTLKVKGMARPLFAYSYQVIDDVKGNGDGLVQRGESVRLHVTVKNIGEGKSNETTAQLRNLSDDGVYINKGRFNVDNLAPGESKSVDFTFDVKQEYKQDTFKVEMSVYDTVLHEFVTDKLSFPVASPQSLEPSQGMVKVTQQTDVLAGAAKDALVVGSAAKDAVFKLTGASGGFFRVELEPGRPGYIADSAAQRATGASARTALFTPKWQVSPPILQLAQAQELVQTGSMKLSGTAKDEKNVADVFVFVSNRTAKIDRRKVFYRSNRKGATPREMAFDANIPLWPGSNIVTVVARENPQVQSQQTLVVERVGGDAMAEGSKQADNFHWTANPSAQKETPAMAPSAVAH